MSGTVHKEWRPLVAKAQKAGWKLERRPSNHLWLLSPDGKTIISFSGTPSDRRAIHQLRSQLRRAGCEL